MKKFIKEYQYWKEKVMFLLSSRQNMNWNANSLALLRFFDKLFDVINDDPFLKLQKTLANESETSRRFLELWLPFLTVSNSDHLPFAATVKNQQEIAPISRSILSKFSQL